MAETATLGIDIGTSGTRALLVAPGGEILAAATAEHSVQSPAPGWSEQNPDQWWTATCEAVRTAMEKASIEPTDVQAVGLSGQMHGSVFLDANDKPLRPAILWNDQRTVAQCEAIERAAGSSEAVIEMVGNRTLTGFTAPKMLWLRDNEPELFQRTRRVLLPKDYVRLCMTGEHATDVGDASGTLLLDVKTRQWSAKMLDRLELDASLLPALYESHEVTGRITAEAGEALGLAAGTPVVAGSGDQPAGAVGMGIVSGGIVGATIGTSGVIFAHSDQPTYDTTPPGGRVHTMCAAVAGKWCVFGCMLSAGGSLQWFRDQLGQAERERGADEGRDPYELLMEQAADAPPGCEGLYFLPYLTGERCPHPDPYARGGWIGLTARHDRAMMVRSVVEGITFGMGDILEIVRGMGVAVSTVRLSGGGARSELWRQLQADIYNAPAATINAHEGPAYGAALLAAVGAGMFTDVPRGCEQWIREQSRYEPDASRAARYAEHHRRYQRLYHALKDEFRIEGAAR